MGVRLGNYQDITRLIELIHEAHGLSKYAELRLDEQRFKHICMEAMRSGSQCLFVSEIQGSVEGFIIGMIDNIYFIGRDKFATDMFFIVSERDNRNAGKLLDLFMRWAEDQPGVVTIRLGITDAMQGWRRTEKLYQRKGLRQEGVLYEKRIEK